MKSARPLNGDASLSINLRRLLRVRRMSACDLDRECGLSSGATEGWLSMRNGITLHSLRLIRRALGCTWDELLDS
jgi:DNA-binding Xre family transcriptional regulator